MRWVNSFLIVGLLVSGLAAQKPDQDIQKALEQMMLLLEKSTEALKDISKTEQNVVPEAKNGFLLYYKTIKNQANVEKRNDLLLKAQIQYRLAVAKEIPSSNILVLVRDGSVELYGKLHDKKMADKAMDIVLHTRGVKDVTSYLIIKEPVKISL